MKTDTKSTENTAESGNKSKPLLQAVVLAPYLPFKLKCQIKNGKEIKIDILQAIYDNKVRAECTFFNIVEAQQGFEFVKPILKPLGDLTKDEKTCDEINEFLEPNGLEINNFLLLKNSLNAVVISWEEMQNVLNILYREHYDVFGLINKRLAVSVHDVVQHCL